MIEAVLLQLVTMSLLVKNITDIWKQDFDSLLHVCVNNNGKSHDLNTVKKSFVSFSVNDILNTIKSLNGKASGLDNLIGEHIKFAHGNNNCL